MRISEFTRPSFDGEASQEAAETGMALASDAERVQLWKEAATAWVVGLERGVEFTADRLTRRCGLPDRGVNKVNVVGAMFSAWAKSGLIVWTGEMRKSQRVDRHVGIQRVWRKT